MMSSLYTIAWLPGATFISIVAAPAFRDIARFDLQYLEVPPDAPETKTSATATATSGG
jgi:hypothetical protein